MDKAIAAIEAQQAKTKARTAAWMVGEQLKDMVRREPGIGALIAQDLTAGGMTLEKAEEKIRDYAGKHRTGHFACVTPAEAEKLLREYFGLPEVGGPSSVACGDTFPQGKAGEGVVSLEDFF
ncbi:MAG: hypothetical protein IKO91_00615 [Oscillospiraceae bacterium]|nr:hypothetical protein [Oscillospiraceae bacterium]